MWILLVSSDKSILKAKLRREVKRPINFEKTIDYFLS